MNIDKDLLASMEDADAFYVIGVKGDTHFTSAQGKDPDDLKTTLHIVQGMLGSVGRQIESKGGAQGNGAILMVLISEAVRRWPKFKK
jgi:hypothetical protein